MTASSGTRTATTHAEERLSLMTSAISRETKPACPLPDAAGPTGRDSSPAEAAVMVEAGPVAAVGRVPLVMVEELPVS